MNQKVLSMDNIDLIKTQVEINEMTNKTGVETPVSLPSEEITLLFSF